MDRLGEHAVGQIVLGGLQPMGVLLDVSGVPLTQLCQHPGSLAHRLRRRVAGIFLDDPPDGSRLEHAGAAERPRRKSRS